MKVFLAGPISGLTYEQAYGWRKRAQEFLKLGGIEALVPEVTDFVNGVCGLEVANRQAGVDAAERIFNYVKDCDVVLVNFTEVTRASIGTVMELGWAKALNKAIVGVWPPASPHDHSFIEWAIDWKCLSLSDALSTILMLHIP